MLSTEPETEQVHQKSMDKDFFPKRLRVQTLDPDSVQILVLSLTWLCHHWVNYLNTCSSVSSTVKTRIDLPRNIVGE